jgi:hypothetical protein
MKSQRRGVEIEKADPGARRRGVIILVAGAALGAMLIAVSGGYRSQLTDWAERNPQRAFDLLLPVLGVTIALPGLAMTWYFWRLGTRVVREGRFPPANSGWLKTTVVIRGPGARRQGRMLQVSAVLLAATLVVFGVVIIRLVINLRNTLAGQGPL